MFTPTEHTHALNTLVDDVAAALAAVDLAVSTRAPATDGSDVDLRLTIDAGPRGRTTYATVVRRGRLDRHLATSLHLPTDRPLLLLAPHISDAVAEVLRARGLDYADAAGNVRLTWDGLLVDVSGRRAKPTTPPRPADTTAARAFTRAGATVVFGLLSWPDLAAQPVREIAATTGVAVGTVHTVLRELTEAGYLRESTSGRTLNRGGELLGRWAEAYTVTLARRLSIASFALPEVGRLPDLEADLLAAGAQLGGERAASRIDPHLQASTATFYVEQMPAPLVAQYRLRPESTGLIHFRRRFWHRVDEGPLVPSPLVYADLVSSGDPRQREHAERIRGVDHRLVELDRT